MTGVMVTILSVLSLCPWTEKLNSFLEECLFSVTNISGVGQMGR